MNKPKSVSFPQGVEASYALMHFNRGCEGTSVGLPQNRRAVIDAGIPTLGFEGNMADPGEVDELGILKRIDMFMEAQGRKRIED